MLTGKSLGLLPLVLREFARNLYKCCRVSTAGYVQIVFWQTWCDTLSVSGHLTWLPLHLVFCVFHRRLQYEICECVRTMNQICGAHMSFKSPRLQYRIMQQLPDGTFPAATMHSAALIKIYCPDTMSSVSYLDKHITYCCYYRCCCCYYCCCCCCNYYCCCCYY
jgi:hypothetical protein